MHIVQQFTWLWWWSFIRHISWSPIQVVFWQLWYLVFQELYKGCWPFCKFEILSLQNSTNSYFHYYACWMLRWKYLFLNNKTNILTTLTILLVGSIPKENKHLILCDLDKWLFHLGDLNCFIYVITKKAYLKV